VIEIYSLVKLSITLYYEKIIYFSKPSVKQNVLFYVSNDAVSHIEDEGTKMSGYFRGL
jgi:hypothetical protein